MNHPRHHDSGSSGNHKYSGASLEHLQEERKHLEALFADRINFYLVFAAGVLAFLFDDAHHQWLVKPALILVVVLSVLMIIALMRTFLLVTLVLRELNHKHAQNAYSFYRKKLKWVLPNANYLLLSLPIALTAFFIYALIGVCKAN